MRNFLDIQGVTGVEGLKELGIGPLEESMVLEELRVWYVCLRSTVQRVYQ